MWALSLDGARGHVAANVAVSADGNSHGKMETEHYWTVHHYEGVGAQDLERSALELENASSSHRLDPSDVVSCSCPWPSAPAYLDSTSHCLQCHSVGVSLCSGT